ncbi:MAG: hypothetical protein AAGC71_07075 [Pseudomonadota bacterium]
MQEIIESGRIVDIMVVVIAFEFIALALYRATTRRGIPLPALLANLAAGGSLMLALGSVLKGYAWQATAACLIVALISHVIDIASRWPRAPQSQNVKAPG